MIRKYNAKHQNGCLIIPFLNGVEEQDTQKGYTFLPLPLLTLRELGDSGICESNFVGYFKSFVFTKGRACDTIQSL